MAAVFFRRLRLSSRRRICIGLIIRLLTLATLWVVGFMREVFAFWRELDYFRELDRGSELDSTWETFSQMGLPDLAKKPPPWNERRKPLFPDVVQLRSWTMEKATSSVPRRNGRVPYRTCLDLSGKQPYMS
jgi:hypothetical protein